MASIDGMRISSEDLAGFIGFPVNTLRTWQKRDGLLRGGYGPGRGHAASFGFAEGLKAYVAFRLAQMGMSISSIATYANHCAAFDYFMDGEPLVVGIRDGWPSLAYDPDKDMSVRIPLEDFGWRLADLFCHKLAASPRLASGIEPGQPTYQAARRDFEERVNLHRLNRK